MTIRKSKAAGSSRARDNELARVKISTSSERNTGLHAHTASVARQSKKKGMRRPAVELTVGKSHFHSPAYALAQQISDAINPDIIKSPSPAKFRRKREKFVARSEDDWSALYFRMGTVVSETKRAVRLVIGGKDMWIPRGMILGIKCGRIAVPKWFARERGICK